MAIRTVAKALVESKAEEDICTRFGGDEFILIGPDYTAKKAETLIKTVEATLQKANADHQYPYKISASMGYYIIEKDSAISLEEAVEKADHQMYQAKKRYIEQL